MDFVSRLTLAFALAFLALPVAAEGVVSGGVTPYSYTMPTYPQGTHASAPSICASAQANAQATNSFTIRTTSCTESNWTFTGTCESGCSPIGGTNSGGAAISRTGGGTSAASCPANATSTNGVCLCAVGFQPNSAANGCVAQGTSSCDVLTRAANAAGLNYTVQPALPAGTLSFCNGGCSMTANFSGTSPTGTTFSPPFSYAGSSCTGNGAGSTAAPAAVQCTAGQCPGTVNGTPVCVPCSSATTSGTKTTSLTGTGTAPTGVTAGSEQTSTTCTGSQCTTVRTFRDAAGAVTATSSDTTPKLSFCEENPEISICKDSSVSQSCASGAASQNCTGDAVQCAIAREQYRRGCELFEKTSPESAAGIAAVAGGERPAGHPGLEVDTTALSLSSNINQSSLLGGAACPSDIAVDLGFMGVRSIAFSTMCPQLNTLGVVLQGLALLAAAFIVFGGGRST